MHIARVDVGEALRQDIRAGLADHAILRGCFFRRDDDVATADAGAQACAVDRAGRDGAEDWDMGSAVTDAYLHHTNPAIE
eukprot:9473714-Pyramimonas_sp.AAC.1